MSLAVTTASLINDPLYLDRCQVDSPNSLVELAWAQVAARRSDVDTVVDFGAGDARFARSGQFNRYVGYEIDTKRWNSGGLGSGVEMRSRCAFTHTATDADLCIGNPPYVRNQDLPLGWRVMAAGQVEARTGVQLSGLANAWQYFLMLGIASTNPTGLVVQVLPYEWVSRPSAAAIRSHVNSMGWRVSVYRLPDSTFSGVLTAASITVIDKRGPAEWNYFEIDDRGTPRALDSAAGPIEGALAYTRAGGPVRAKRGLSPGTQKLLTMTEGERIHAGLHIGRDVVRCVTSLRDLPAFEGRLTSSNFDATLRHRGAKCWLIRTDREPSERLRGYLESCAESDYNTATCLAREVWWQFAMPAVPALLISQSFKGKAPKVLVNEVKAHAVGGVCGVYNLDAQAADAFRRDLEALDLNGQLIPYAGGLYKLEIGQLNSLLEAFTQAVMHAREGS